MWSYSKPRFVFVPVQSQTPTAGGRNALAREQAVGTEPPVQGDAARNIYRQMVPLNKTKSIQRKRRCQRDSPLGARKSVRCATKTMMTTTRMTMIHCGYLPRTPPSVDIDRKKRDKNRYGTREE